MQSVKKNDDSQAEEKSHSTNRKNQFLPIQKHAMCMLATKIDVRAKSVLFSKNENSHDYESNKIELFVE